VKTRRWGGLLLFVSGLSLCGAAGWHYLRGSLAQRQARAEFEARVARATASPQVPASIVTAELAMSPVSAPSAPYPYGRPLARLIAPAAEIDEIVFGGSDQETLARGPGHVPGTALPGSDGPPNNCVITGHRDSHFRRLGWLKRGNTVELETLSGRTKYRIVERKIVQPDAVSVLAPTPQPRLTLITCYPFSWVGSAPQRLVLIASPIGSTKIRHGL
jgi:sortase A